MFSTFFLNFIIPYLFYLFCSLFFFSSARRCARNCVLAYRELRAWIIYCYIDYVTWLRQHEVFFPSAEFHGIWIVILIYIYIYVSEILLFFSQNVNICFIISEFVWTLTFGSSQRPNFILNFWILDKERHFVFIVTRLHLTGGQLTHCEQFITPWMKLDFGPVVKSADYSKCDLLTLLFTSR